MEDGTRPGADTARADADLPRVFLIADLRGYTTYTAEQGDAAAGALAMRFAEVARAAVSANEGRLLEIRGDEALAVFSSARRALRAALDLHGRVAEAGLPRRCGIGIDAGEAVAVDEGFRGTAINRAARVCALAGPGDTLATETVVSLAAHVDGVSFLATRTVRLKGFDADVRVIPVVAAVANAPHPKSASADAPTRRHRTLAAAAVAVTIIGLTGAALLSGMPGSSSRAPVPSASLPAGLTHQPPGLVIADAQTGTPLTSLPLKQPDDASWSASDVWVVDHDPAALYEIDGATGQQVAELSLGFDPCGSAVEGGDVLVADCDFPLIHRLHVASGREVLPAMSLATGKDDTAGVVELTPISGSMWAYRDFGTSAEIALVDPAKGVVKRCPIPVSGASFAGTDKAIWVAVGGDPYGQLLRLDPADCSIGSPVQVPGGGQVAVGGGFVWVLGPSGTISKLDERGVPVGSVVVPGANSLSFSDGKLWVGGGRNGTVTSVDPRSDATHALDVGHFVITAVESGGRLAVTSVRSMADALAGLQGTVLKVIAYSGPLDPAMGYPSSNQQFGDATCAGLLSYPDAAAPAGWQLQPELASGLPDISADGLTYTFRIRPGVRFSPPSNEPITAETFRTSIQRALSPALGSGANGVYFLGDIVGLDDFRTGKATDITGISANGDRLTIRLTTPSGSFLDRLSVGFFCPVPSSDLAPVADGLPILSGYSGPYRVVEGTDQYVLLQRNTNYDGPRKPAFDWIVYQAGISQDDAVGKILSDESEYFHGSNAVMAPGGSLDQEWGAESQHAKSGDQHYFSVPAAPSIIVLDPRDPFLQDVTVRQAIALALDRQALAGADSEGSMPPSSQLFPPSVPGHLVGEPYALDGPDVARAQTLMAGRTGHVVLAVFDDGRPGNAAGDIISKDLAAIGISVEVREVPNTTAAASEPGSDITMVEPNSIVIPYPDSYALLSKILATRVPAGWAPSGTQEAVDSLDELTGDARTATAQRIAKDWLSDQAWVAVFEQSSVPQLFGSKVGCEVFPPGIYVGQVSLAHLCPKGGPP